MNAVATCIADYCGGGKKMAEYMNHLFGANNMMLM